MRHNIDAVIIDHRPIAFDLEFKMRRLAFNAGANINVMGALEIGKCLIALGQYNRASFHRLRAIVERGDTIFKSLKGEVILKIGTAF